MGNAFRNVYAAFERDKKTANDIIKRMCPSYIEKPDYLLFLLTWKLLGDQGKKTPEDVFAILDKDRSGALDREELGAAIRKLEFYVGDEEL